NNQKPLIALTTGQASFPASFYACDQPPTIQKISVAWQQHYTIPHPTPRQQSIPVRPIKPPDPTTTHTAEQQLVFWLNGNAGKMMSQTRKPTRHSPRQHHARKRCDRSSCL
ncbi:Hypothetical predicted protein, partial [Drosophila guanche]